MVAMNPQTWDQDVAVDRPGRLSVLRQHQADAGVEVPRRHRRDRRAADRDAATREYTDPRQRQLFKNIIYVGALAALLDIDPPVIEQLLAEQFKGQGQADRAEHPRAAHGPRLGADESATARSACACAAPTRSATASSSTATPPPALGAVYGGATVCAWYPITPSSSLAEAFQRYCDRFRVDKETGKQRFAIVQAEDELASIGMVIGAAWNGARAFTATSGPGISLMQEFFGPGLFRRNPGGDLRRAARRPVHRHADAHPAMRPDWPAPMPRTATPSTCCCSPKTRTSASSSARWRSTWPTGCRRRSSCMLDLDIGMNERLTQAVPLGRQPRAWTAAR